MIGEKLPFVSFLYTHSITEALQHTNRLLFTVNLKMGVDNRSTTTYE